MTSGRNLPAEFPLCLGLAIAVFASFVSGCTQTSLTTTADAQVMASSPVGTWRWSEDPTREFTLLLEEIDGELSGTLCAELVPALGARGLDNVDSMAGIDRIKPRVMYEEPVEALKFDQGTLTFTFLHQYTETRYQGKLAGRTVEGTFTRTFGTPPPNIGGRDGPSPPREPVTKTWRAKR